MHRHGMVGVPEGGGYDAEEDEVEVERVIMGRRNEETLCFFRKGMMKSRTFLLLGIGAAEAIPQG